MALLRLLALCASGCALAGACETLPHGAASLQQTPTDGAFTYGTSLFSLTFDAETYALRNLTTCSADKQHAQGLLSDDTWGGSSGAASSQPLGSLWQLNYTACTTTMPFGITLDALASNATKRQVRSEGNNGEWYSLRLDLTACCVYLAQHHVARSPGNARTTVLTLQWFGVGAGASGLPSGVDVSVTVRMDDGYSQARLGAWVDRRGQSNVCIQDLALPNLRLVLRDRSLDTLFAPWFFGQAGMTAAELPG
eukprot:COSAG03_NODE_4908_length_1399_cov_1.488462_2_plen_251_part_01